MTSAWKKECKVLSLELCDHNGGIHNSFFSVTALISFDSSFLAIDKWQAIYDLVSIFAHLLVCTEFGLTFL